jgi:hypothetical protein
MQAWTSVRASARRWGSKRGIKDYCLSCFSSFIVRRLPSGATVADEEEEEGEEEEGEEEEGKKGELLELHYFS